MTKEETNKLVELLKQIEPGFLNFDVFIQIARLVVLSIIEFVPLRIKGDKIEVLLLSRGGDDPIWPNELHVPGTVIRPTDNENKIYMAFNRIINEELKGTKLSEPYFVGSILHKSKRGAEHAQVYWVEVKEEPKVGKFYPVDELPTNLIESQIKFIKQASKSFGDNIANYQKK